MLTKILGTFDISKKHIYDLVEAEGEHDWVDHCILGLVIANVTIVILQTVPGFSERFSTALKIFKYFSIGIFSIEYFLRLWACTYNDKYSHPIFGRIRYALKPIVIIDLVSILPFFIPGINLDLRHLQMFKMARYSDAMQRVIKIVKSQGSHLISGLVLIGMLMVASASLLFFLEHDAQPKLFTSIPAAMWWAIVTITTVGYGDIFPITLWGKVVAAFTAICGIGLFALPAGIMGAAFLDDIKEEKDKTNPPKYCHNCGVKSLINE